MKTQLGHLHWNRPTTSKVFTLCLSMSNYFLRTLCSMCTKLVKIADAPYHHHFLSCSLRIKKNLQFNSFNTLYAEIINSQEWPLFLRYTLQKRNETSATERLALAFQLHRHFAKRVWNLNIYSNTTYLLQIYILALLLSTFLTRMRRKLNCVCSTVVHEIQSQPQMSQQKLYKRLSFFDCGQQENSAAVNG